MSTEPTKLLTFAVLCCAGLHSGIGFGQPDAPPTDSSAPVAVDEEIVVRGRTLGQIRTQIHQAEEAVYDRFNAINSDDEFDIHCRWDPVTGSRMLRRLCEANFWRAAEANIAQETVRGLQGSAYTISAQQFRAEQFYKRQLLESEMRRLIVEDEELLDAFRELANLHETLAESKGGRRNVSTASRVSISSEEGLPYEAEIIVEVRIGRDSWAHALTKRTFAIARVFGEIRSVEIDCEQRGALLEYEAGVEWTLPEQWGRCNVLVNAKRDTTFALYEFN